MIAAASLPQVAYVVTIRVSTPSGKWTLESVHVAAGSRWGAQETAWTRVATRPGVWQAEVVAVDEA